MEVNPEKGHPADFALWKRAEPGHIMRWPSPWGWGYPGWHIECSAMSMKYLGETFDIHGGGIENIFPHHECEIAQSEGATGKPFVRYWLHNGMVMVGGDEMHKSLGNFITLRDAFKKYSPMALRLFILNSHYRSPTDFSDQALLAATEGLNRLQNALFNIDLAIGKGLQNTNVDQDKLSGEEEELFIAAEEAEAKFQEAMDDDFNTASALGRLFDLARLGNIVSEREATDVRRTLLRKVKEKVEKIARVLGLKLERKRKVSSEDYGKLMDLLVDLRSELRKNKQWALSDKIRDELGKMGVILEDRPGGTIWR